MAEVKTLYNEDFFAWSQQQAEALRSTARGRSNQPLDWENLAEEIEDLGKSDRRELRSRLALIIEHLVKLDYSRARDPRRNWRETVRRERAEVERILEDSPSLRREIPDLIGKEVKKVTDLVITELEERGEVVRPVRGALRPKPHPERPLFTNEQILGDWFPPETKKPARRAREP
jgi:hypothetical protein